MRDPAHPWRVELRTGVEKLIDDLATDPQMRARAEAIKAELLSSPLVIDEQARTLWGGNRTRPQFGYSGRTRRRLRRPANTRCKLSAIGSLEDEGRRMRMNRRIVAVVLQHLMLLYRFEIGAYIERVVRGWDTATFGRSAGIAGRQRSAIHPYQWHAGRWSGRLVDLHCVEVDSDVLARWRAAPSKNRSTHAAATLVC